MKLLTPEQVAEQLGLTVNHLAEMRQDGKGPDYVKFDVDNYIMANLENFDSNRAAAEMTERFRAWQAQKARTGA